MTSLSYIKIVDDPQIFSINQLSSQSDQFAYTSEAKADSQNYSFQHSLNGQWNFKHSESVENRTVDFSKTWIFLLLSNQVA